MAICATVNRAGTNIVEKHQLDVGMYQEISPIVSHIFTNLLDGIPKKWFSTQSSWITPHIVLEVLNFLDRLMIVELDKEPYDTTLISRQLALIDVRKQISKDEIYSTLSHSPYDIVILI